MVEKTSDKCNRYMNYTVPQKVISAVEKTQIEQGKGDFES